MLAPMRPEVVGMLPARERAVAWYAAKADHPEHAGHQHPQARQHYE